jgi:transposase
LIAIGWKNRKEITDFLWNLLAARLPAANFSPKLLTGKGIQKLSGMRS